MTKYKQLDAFLDHFATALELAGVDPIVARKLAEDIAADCVVFRWPTTPPGAASAAIPLKYWAVRDEDLKLAEAIVAVVVSVAGADGSTAMPVADLVAMLWRTGVSLRRDGIELDRMRYAILAVLSQRTTTPLGRLAGELERAGFGVSQAAL